MKPILHNDTIQIEITNACVYQCGNCTRFVGHHKKPFFMDFDTFKEAVDATADFAKMDQFPGAHFVGMMGGEPLIHPEFERFCNYLHSKVEPRWTGLWTTFPKGFEHYREVIVETFGNIFLNDHTRDDVMHSPVLVSANELPCQEWEKWYRIEHCWAQASWSASINPFGAYFCEIAASLAMLLNKRYDAKGNEIAWPVIPGWWTRVPINYTHQIKEFCGLCGMAMPLKKRASVDGIDDISPKMYERLKNTSPKIKSGKYAIHDLNFCQDDRPYASYKDPLYRDKIADRYGIFLFQNDLRFLTPYLKKNWKEVKNNGEIKQADGISESEHSRET